MRRICTHVLTIALSGLLLACGGGGAGDLFGIGAGDIPGIPDAGEAPPAPGSGELMSQAELDWAMDVFTRTNQVRALQSLPPLTWDDPAAQVAFDHCLYQQGQGAISHTGPGGNSPGDRLQGAGINWSSYGENVAVGQSTPAVVVDAWVNSPGHYANMISTNNTRLGVGCQTGPGGPYSGPWWTQVFYRP